jgi:hypothetical protein
LLWTSLKARAAILLNLPTRETDMTNLIVSDVTLTFGGLQALFNVNMTVNQGKFFLWPSEPRPWAEYQQAFIRQVCRMKSQVL